jgi:exodeoxyribonuclease VII small subunit
MSHKTDDTIKTEPNFEEALTQIDEIVAKLESGEIPLDESLQAFQKGMELIAFCYKKLDVVETKLKTLLEDANGDFKLMDAE